MILKDCEQVQVLSLKSKVLRAQDGDLVSERKKTQMKTNGRPLIFYFMIVRSGLVYEF
jgi:hypothetical protein